MRPPRRIEWGLFDDNLRGRGIGLVILLMGPMVGLVAAQLAPTVPTTAPAAQAIPPELAGISGLTGNISDDDLLAFATELTDQQRLDDAEKILIHLARKDSRNYRALEQLGAVYERRSAKARGNTADPNANNQADTYDTYAVNAYLDAAQQAYEAENYSKAERLCDRVFILQPANARVQLILARIFSKTERSIQASQHYQAYIKTHEGKQDTKAHLELARIYQAARQPFQALAVLNAARDIDSENVEVLLELSQANYERRRFQEALQTASDVIKKAPNDPRCFDNMASLLARQGQDKEAAEYSRKAIELARVRVFDNPDNIEEVKALRGYYDRYQRTLNRLLSGKQEDLALRIELARVMVEQSEINNTLTLQNALRLLEQVGPEARDNIKMLETKANIQYLLKLPEAAETARRLIRLDANNVVARRILQTGSSSGGVPTIDSGGGEPVDAK